MSTERIKQGLQKIFEKHQIVFWYDKKSQLREEFESLELPDIEKIEIKNNEFGIKYQILKLAPTNKFLLYQEGDQPADIDNWLLDVFLANGEFRADKEALYLGEMGLGLEFADVIKPHADFFNAVKRREALLPLLKPDDTPSKLRMKLVAVCAGAEPRIDEIVESLLDELAEKEQEKIKLIERCGLAPFLWEQLARFYSYQSERPGIRDFAIELFKSCYAMGTEGQVKLSGDALVFLKRWKDSRRYESAFETLSHEFASLLNISEDLHKFDYKRLIDIDYFQIVDQKILGDLICAVTDKTISAGECALLVRRRRQTHWYKKYQDLYQAVEYASLFMHLLDESDLRIKSLPDGIEAYSKALHKIDQMYRKFICHVRRPGEVSLMEKLVETVENLYTNSYLVKVNEAWQPWIDSLEKWEIPGITTQKHFFQRWVAPFLSKGNKVFVVISDAMRYEIGDELLGLIRQEDRYEARIDPALSMLPSYTQLGMAALLPNQKIKISPDDSGTTLVDGQSSMGTANRTKILANATGQKGCAIRAEKLMSLNRDDCRSLVKDHDVVYIYHNRIDATGDKKETEGSVFEAAEETLQDLIKIIKKLTGANANNIIVTADHGFLYQNRAIEESDFASVEVEGKKVLYRDRRFGLGFGLTSQKSLKKFSSEQIGLDGDVEIQIPKSINRLRLKGSGSRFVHGGSSLQEIVIPVIQINKKRQSDISTVTVEILKGTSSIITSSQLSVAFYQVEAVDDKVQPRKLRAGLYTKRDQLISDRHDLTFDLTSDNPRERELQTRFLLTRLADEVNGEEVSLRLEELVPETAQYREYKSVKYTVRRSFTSDFEF